MRRRSLFIAVATVTCQLAASLCLADATAKPNILFIAVDDLRPELACYNAPGMHTPNLDRLAASGTLFQRAYCQVSVCNPSRASLLSGTRPDTNQVMDNQHFLREYLPDVVTLPQHFKNHGWHARSLGKIFHHSAREPGEDPISWSEPAWFRSPLGREWFDPSTLAELNRLKKLPEDERPKLMRGPPFEGSDQPDDAYPDGQTALKAIETLNELKESKQPFFLAVGFVKPHLTFSCPKKYWDLYPVESIHLPNNISPPTDVARPALHNAYELRSYGSVPAEGDIDNDLALKLNHGYRACVSFLDAQVGRVLDELMKLGLSENTAVVLWGDHGYHLGENGVFTKMTNFEIGTRVPLIARLPHRGKPGQRVNGLVELIDIYPTLVEYSGLPMPTHLEGKSFLPLIENPDTPWKSAVFSDYMRNGSPKLMGRGPDKYRGRSIRTDRWRYTEWTGPKNEDAGRELYDHLEDPHETKNLALDPIHVSTVESLSQQLHAGWQAALPPE